MAPTLVNSYYVQISPQGTSALVTPSFTPSNGEVLVIKLVTWDSGSPLGAPTGGSQTYTSRVVNAPGGFNQWAAIYTAVISGSPGSMTVSSTPSVSLRGSMVVERWSVRSSRRRRSRLVELHRSGNRVDHPDRGDERHLLGGRRRPTRSTRRPAPTSLRRRRTASEMITSAATAATTTPTSRLPEPAVRATACAPTGMGYVTVAIEVQAAASGAPAFPTNLEQRRRLLVAPRQVRGAARIATPVRAQVNPPFPTNGIKQPRRLRGLLARRGEMFTPVPSQAVVAAPAFPPRPVRARLKGLRLYRGEMFAPPSDQLSDAQQYQRPRLRLPRIFRGRTGNAGSGADRGGAAGVSAAERPDPAAGAADLPWPCRLGGARPDRGRCPGLPAGERPHPRAWPAPVPGPRVGSGACSDRRHAAVVHAARGADPAAFRPHLPGRTSAPVPDQLVAPPAPHLRPRGMAPRRGHAAMPARRRSSSRRPPTRSEAGPATAEGPALSGVARPQCRFRLRWSSCRRSMVPLFTRLKQHAARIFRGESRAVLPPVCDCVTHRPNLGTTSRSSSGTTAQPNSGTTSRPCSCND
jgi:hypothetical protein